MSAMESPRNPQQPYFPPEPELNLLLRDEILDEPLYKRLFRGIDEFFFPKKLPPLVLTSKPVPVKDIWGFYNYKGRGAFASTIVHIMACLLRPAPRRGSAGTGYFAVASPFSAGR